MFFVEIDFGGIPKWPNGADCKSVGVSLRRFESAPPTGYPDTQNFAGVTQLVECQPSKLNVAGSSPVARSQIIADIAQW